jgi:hypothetical protein
MMFKWFIGRLLLMAWGLGLAGLGVYVLLLAFPQLLPASLRDPLDQRQKNQTWGVRYHLSDGDLFYHQPGQVKPPLEDALLSEHQVIWDAEGFRQPQTPADDYPIIVLGDSYTEAWMAAQPWPDVLAAELQTPVRNLAYRGYGPAEYVEILREYGQTGPQWLLVGFFEGNDLQNIATSAGIGEPNGELELLGNLLDRALDPPDYEIVESPDGNYKYPLALYIGDKFYELGFYDFYLWILNAERATYDDSQNIAAYRQGLRDMAALSPGACRAIVYLPSKEHIYFPYAEPYGRRWVLEGGMETLLEEGWLNGRPEIVDFDLWLSRRGNLRDSLRAATAAEGWLFFDLTPIFEARAEAGEMLYLTYDTHWNQAGQLLAGQEVARLMEGLGCE